jgi:2-polyprenyl-3-methyl-5-hydroxy-6-metoxy-1,4-benzoquinol methylase
LSIKRYLPPKPSDTVLDVGCGSGVVTSFLGEFGATVVGIDGNLDAIQFANQQFSHPNVKFQLGLVDENIQLDMLIDKYIAWKSLSIYI